MTEHILSVYFDPKQVDSITLLRLLRKQHGVKEVHEYVVKK